MSWLYSGELVEEIDPKYVGFVYVITNKTNDKQYIGKKVLKFRKTKTVKGKKKGFYVESDWKTYYGSNEVLKTEVENLGASNFERKILKLCRTKGELSYYEAKYQFDLDVLLHPDKYYNEWIMVKTRRSHVLSKTLLSEKNES